MPRRESVGNAAVEARERKDWKADSRCRRLHVLRMLNRWKLWMNHVLDLYFKDHIVKGVLVDPPDIKSSASGLPIRPHSAEYRLRKLLFRTFTNVPTFP